MAMQGWPGLSIEMYYQKTMNVSLKTDHNLSILCTITFYDSPFTMKEHDMTDKPVTVDLAMH